MPPTTMAKAARAEPVCMMATCIFRGIGVGHVVFVLPRALHDQLGEQPGPDDGLVDDSAFGDGHDLLGHGDQITFAEQRPDMLVEKGLERLLDVDQMGVHEDAVPAVARRDRRGSGLPAGRRPSTVADR